ncbi:uncharacterized protein LOC134098411 isoform X2 [Sardina pilchardus]|uniref:uncharacterized protein LOC134098411 isoform X2 n=1 Tax=Sardina pilchardus TaxID=27697 RepID=UPI002E13225A
MELSASYQLLWIISVILLRHTEGLSPSASLLIRPSRTQLFESESVSLSCEVLDNSTGWRIRWNTDKAEESDCPFGWRSDAGPTCSTSSISSWDKRVYWCESESGQRSNAVNITFNWKPRPVLKVSSHSWLAEGDSVTLSCEVTDTSLNWTFLWYRAVPSRTVPHGQNSPDVRYRGHKYSVELLSDSSRGAGGSYTLSPAALQHTGLYVCRAEGGEPTYQTEFSDVKALWVTGLSPPASLVIRPNRNQLFQSESVSLSCEVQDNSTGWRIRFNTDKAEESDCPRGWRSDAGPTCSTSSLSSWDRGVYWCESDSGEHSNAVNITVNSRPRLVLRFSSHSWPAEGDSVTLSCEVRDTTFNWTFLWYRAVPSRTVPYGQNSPDVRYKGNKYSVELLSDSSRGAGGSYTLSPAALQHTGLYVCRAEGREPTYQTEFSDVKALWVTGLSPPASLVIRPSRTQLFESESVSLSCEVQDNSTGWRLEWSTHMEKKSDCPYRWRSDVGPTCSTSSTSVLDTGVYWCESESGQHSNAVNITFNSRPRPVLGVSPHSWPAEGDSVTLSCEVRDTSFNWTFLWYRAVFSRIVPSGQNSPDVHYRGNKYSVELLSESRGAGGSYTLSPAALQHTGLYVCRAEGGEPTYQTRFSDVKTLWVTGLYPPASLVIRPNRTQLFESESVSLSCEVQDNSTGWRLRWNTDREEKSDCPRGWRSDAGPTCSTSSISEWDNGVYWCESKSEQHSNAVNITFNSRPRPVLRVSPHSWPAEGDSVTLSCEVTDTSLNWTFLWYRAVPSRTVPNRKNSPDVHYKGNTYSVEPVSDSSRGAGGSYTLSPAALQHTGLYVCRAKGGEPTYRTEFSDVKAIWVTGLSPPASLIIRPSRTQLFESESVTLSCEVPDDSAGWRLRWNTDKKEESDCPRDWRSDAGPTCSTSSISVSDKGVYWCESESGQHSNAVNITFNSKPQLVLRVSPHSWPSEGNSTTLGCEVRDTFLNWTFLWYRAVPSRFVPNGQNLPDVRYKGNKYSVELLSDSSRGAGGSYTLSPAALQHTGLYVCRAEGGEPTYQTAFSDVKALWVTGLSPPASLVISPSRTRLFHSEPVSLSCEVQDNSTGWRLRWNTDREEESDCPHRWGSDVGPTCRTSSASLFDDGVYWCESESGQHSNAVNITFNSRPRSVLRVSPHSWLAEGDSVTLSCEVRYTSSDWTFLWYRAVLSRTAPYGQNSPYVRYKGNTYSVELLSDSSRGAGGSYTLSPAAVQHTGLYVCRAEGGEPTYQTEFSDVKALWVTGLSPPVSLVISPSRTQLFESESVSLSCEVQDDSTGWRIRWNTDRDEESDCPRGWRSDVGPTCSTSSISANDKGVYWCESESGQRSNAVNITFNSKPQLVLRVFPHSWTAEGDSVTLGCEVRDTSLNWTFLWYRAVPSSTVPNRQHSSDVRYRGNTYSVELLSDSSRGAGGSYTLSPAALQHTGLYVCRAEGGEPTYQTKFSDVNALWVTGLSPPVSLVIRPSRTQLFESESVSLSCEVQDDSTGWRLRWFTRREEESGCPRYWRSDVGPTCSISSTSASDKGVYWCESESGQHSNAVNITFNSRPRPVLRVSPHSWPAERDSVTLSCEVRDTSLNWTFLWYRAVLSRTVPYGQNSPYVHYRGNTYSVELLSDSSRGAGGSYTLSPAALQHTGLYVCRAEGGEPTYQTEFSDVKALWVTGLSPPASLVIRPNRTQLFESESVSLSCEVQDNSAGWRIRWNTDRDEKSDCPRGWRSDVGPTCSTSSTSVSDTGVYWCESESGQHSNAVNITFISKPHAVLRVSSHSWPAEGDSVTLSCKVRHTSSDWTFLWYRAVPSRTVPYGQNSPDVRYKGNTYSVELLSDSSRGAGGSYTLSPAALQHTGLYVCRAEGGEPTYQTEFSDVKALWVTGLSPPASLVIRPSRTQLFESESVSLSCEVQDNSTGWRLRWNTDREEESDCPRDWRSDAGPTCSTSSISANDKGVYWCESESGQHSNAVNITFNSGPRPVLRFLPHSSLAEGDSVTLSCEVRDTTFNWTLLWYRAVPSRFVPNGQNSPDVRYNGNTYSVELLSDSSRGAGGSYTLSPAALQHTGLYVCRAEGGEPTYQTVFSDVKALWVTGLSPPASLVIRPNRTQLFESESVSLSCEVQDNSTGWRLRWNTDKKEESDCPRGWRSDAGTTCSTRSASLWDRGRYWCESESGQHSNAVNIIFNYSSRGAGGSYTLSPAALQHTGLYVCRAEGGEPTYQTEFSDVKPLWVTGLSPPASLVISPNRTQLFATESVSLRCEVQDNSTGWRIRWKTARDQKSDCPRGWRSVVGPTCSTSSTSVSDKGVYWCESESGQHSNAVNITFNSRPSPVLRFSSNSWPAEGDSVTLSCKVTDTSLNWTFLWYRAVPSRTVPDRQHSPDVRYKGNKYSVELLSDSSRGAEGSYTLSPAALQHTGLYVCRAEGGEPTYRTVFSDVKPLWVTGLSPPASLIIRPSRTQLFESESVSLSCEVQDNSTGWGIRWNTDREQESDCPRYWRSVGPTCNTSSTSVWDNGVYWCESESGQHSNAVNITFNSRPIPVLRVSPHSWPAVGDSVTLSCKVRYTSLNWTFLWYRAVPSRTVPYGQNSPDVHYKGNTYSVELLSDSSRGAGGSYTLSPAALQHTGLYVCRAEGGEPTYQTAFSDVNALWVTGLSPPASLVIRPRTQLFKSESVSLSCEVQDNSTGWRLRWNTDRKEKSDCPRGWRSDAGPTCSTSSISTHDKGVYWCESESGQHSKAVNMSVTSGNVILESPTHPVTEGDPLTLRCVYQSRPSTTSADFYKDGSLLQSQTAGEMTIPAVSKAHTGSYRCRHPKLGESPESWVTVTGRDGP